MRAAPPILVTAAAVIASAWPGSALAAPATAAGTRAGSGSVGPARIARAVAHAERATTLWATVNICDTHQYRNDLGVRGQMPALGFPADLAMNVQVDYWSTTTHRFVAIQTTSASHALALGRHTDGLYQDGAVFPFRAHTGLLNATITFTWSHNGKVIGQTRRRTTAGHHGADFGSPPRYSAAQCTIP